MVLMSSKRRTGRPGVLWFMGSQRVRHDWATELNWRGIQWKHMESLPEKTVVKLPLAVLRNKLEWMGMGEGHKDWGWENKNGRFCARKINFKDGASGKDLANKDLSSQSYGFSSSHVWMWELYHKESWVQKNSCFWIVVLEETLWESLGLQGDPTSPS